MLWLIGYLTVGLVLSIVYLVRYAKKGKMNDLPKIKRVAVGVLFVVLYSFIWSVVEIFSFVFALFRVAKFHNISYIRSKTK